MSILIKGMEMPKCCGKCPISCLSENHGCYKLRCNLLHRFVSENVIDVNCPLVEVPPHGRLIDADELIEKQKEDAEIFMGSTNYGDKVRYDEAMNAVANIVNAPTVIPADKDGET